MRSRNGSTGNTHDRLLEVAAGTFAEKGFRDATVADICKKAGVNIAAVNYHFGSKEALYKDAWQHAHRCMLQTYPPDGGVNPNAPPEQRLRGQIRAMLQRGLSDAGLDFQIMSHEIINPTGLLAQVIHDTIRPLREAMENIIRELIGDGAGEESVRLCAMSVIGPCLHVMRRQRMQKRLGHAPWFHADMLETLVEHFAIFVLAGIDGVRRGVTLAGTSEDKSGDSE